MNYLQIRVDEAVLGTVVGVGDGVGQEKPVADIVVERVVRNVDCLVYSRRRIDRVNRISKVNSLVPAVSHVVEPNVRGLGNGRPGRR